MARVEIVFLVTQDNQTTEVDVLGCEYFMNDF